MNENTNNKNQITYNYDTPRDVSYVAETVVTKWGNSQGIRISKSIMEQMNIKINDLVEVSLSNGTMYIRKSCRQKSLQERLESFYNQPIDKIFVESTEEDWGTPKGDELW